MLMMVMYMLNNQARELLSLVEEGMSINQISYLLNIDYQKIYDYLNLLHIHGFNISRTYYANGDTSYELIKHSKFTNKNKNVLITEPDDNTLELLVVSDFHIGSHYERFDLIRDLYFNYCINNNIHIILNIGDLLEGVINLPNIRKSWDEQVYDAIKKIPHIDNLLTFLVLGNHDHSILLNYGQNIRDVIKNYRDDIIPLGYGQAELKIKNDEIVLQHPLLVKEFKKSMYDHKVIIRGHGHSPKFKYDGNNYLIYAPSLSDLNFNKSEFPGAMKLTLKMHLGLIEEIILEELSYINHKLHTTSEMYIYTGANKKFKKNVEIKNEREYPKIFKKV